MDKNLSPTMVRALAEACEHRINDRTEAEKAKLRTLDLRGWRRLTAHLDTTKAALLKRGLLETARDPHDGNDYFRITIEGMKEISSRLQENLI